MTSPRHRLLLLIPALLPLFAGCDQPATEAPSTSAGDLSKYTTVRLETELPLTDAHRQMIPLLIGAADQMDAIFWQQAYGNREALLDSIDDPEVLQFVEWNYGPWDRLEGDVSFVEGVGPKPPGANFYPPDLTAEELKVAIETAGEQDDAERIEALRSLYTLVRRDEDGALATLPYTEDFRSELWTAAVKLREAAKLAEDEGLRRYLELRAEALLTSQYRASDLAWMDMKESSLDFVIGPIETYEDQLAGYKAAASASLLVKDQAWSGRLGRYTELLPELQRALPVAEAYKRETPGTDSDLGAYDLLYAAGDANAGSKSIAFNLPNDEQVQLEKGTRRVQLKNAMRAKFDRILVPIAGVLIAQDQRSHVTFDAFFGNTMFHEVAHGLGIKNILEGSSTVRQALRDHASALEEGKADVLGLFMVRQLHAQGELEGEVDLDDHYVTFLASIFRSIRFGSSSAHGVANLLRFNFFQELGAFSRDDSTGTYRIEGEGFQRAIDALSERILCLQGDGDYEAVAGFVEKYGQEPVQLRADLDRLEQAGIPVDIVYEQGLSVLGL